MNGLIEPRMGDIADVHYDLSTARELSQTGRVTIP